MYEVKRKQLGKLEGAKSTKKRDPFDAIYLCELLSPYFCGHRLH
jgi:hypothetical protein